MKNRYLSQSILITLSMLLSLCAPINASEESTDNKPKPKHHGSSRWGANYFPNVELTTHEGKKVRFFDDLIEDKVVMINFIYTNCPDACPLETMRLAEVQEILKEYVGTELFMYSITIDPERDTPDVLAEYRERYQARDGWTFLTGAEADITLLRKKLGLYIDDIQQDENDHNLSMVLGNQRTGRWQKASPFENPYILATQFGDWMTNFSINRLKGNNYEDAPELRNLTDGEKLWRTRCQVCHNIGNSSENAKKLTRVGPDLLGVTDRRERAWLHRWVKEPDVMLAEEDPIALGLYYAFNKVPMPNLRMSDLEVEQVLGFIESEGKRIARYEILNKTLTESREDDEGESCCQKAETSVINTEVVIAEPEVIDPTSECCEEAGLSEANCCSQGPASKSRNHTVWGSMGVALGALALTLRRWAL